MPECGISAIPALPFGRLSCTNRNRRILKDIVLGMEFDEVRGSGVAGRRFALEIAMMMVLNPRHRDSLIARHEATQ